MPRVGILILSCRHTDYQQFKEAQRNSWVKDFESINLPVHFVEGVSTLTAATDLGVLANYSIRGDTIDVGCKDTLDDSFSKTMAGLDYMFSVLKCDVVLRTNLSSFLDVEMFKRYMINNIIDSRTYCGVVGKTNLGRESSFIRGNRIMTKLLLYRRSILYFASGACFFIGSAVFNEILKCDKKKNLIDDVAISLNGAQQFLTKKEFPRLWVNSLIRGTDRKLYDRFIALDGFHYRFKSDYRDVDAIILSQFSNIKFRQEWLQVRD